MNIYWIFILREEERGKLIKYKKRIERIKILFYDTLKERTSIKNEEKEKWSDSPQLRVIVRSGANRANLTSHCLSFR
jgi:hypothetical protein